MPMKMELTYFAFVVYLWAWPVIIFSLRSIMHIWSNLVSIVKVIFNWSNTYNIDSRDSVHAII